MADEDKRPEGEDAGAKKPENQPESTSETTGPEVEGAAQPTDAVGGPHPEGMSADVKGASPLEPTPGITQDSDSAARSLKPGKGEEHAGASQHGGPHDHVAPHAHDEHGLSHTTTVQLLVGVFAALTILTVLTVAVTGVDLGSQGNFIVAMVIATIKACLVMAFFMHMLWDSKFNVLVFVSSFLFVLLFLTLSLADRGEYQRAIDSWETAQTAQGG